MSPPTAEAPPTPVGKKKSTRSKSKVMTNPTQAAKAGASALVTAPKAMSHVRPMSSVRGKVTSQAPFQNDNTLLRVDFEVRGKVQGVYFRKYSQKKGNALNLRGWVQNTDRGTVIGCMEGPRVKINQMKQWLKHTGSPKSIISGAEFRDTRLDIYTFSPGFIIVKHI